MELSKAIFRNISRSSGFSLIELLIVIMMLGVLSLGLILTLNPIAQYNKAKDSQREHDLAQIQRALDSYTNDTHCYPTTLTFGSKWSVNGQVYMEKVPQDPNCSSSGDNCYVYETDGTSCPQWNVLYAALKGSADLSHACPLTTRNGSTTCLPIGYTTSGYNYCVTSGDIDCSVIAGTTFGAQASGGTGGSGESGGSGGGTPTSTPGPSATPTPPVCPGDQYFGCSGGDNRCNSIAPKEQCTTFGGQTTCYCDQHCDQSCTFN